jgi:hypothetical protein
MENVTLRPSGWRQGGISYCIMEVVGPKSVFPSKFLVFRSSRTRHFSLRLQNLLLAIQSVRAGRAAWPRRFADDAAAQAAVGVTDCNAVQSDLSAIYVLLTVAASERTRDMVRIARKKPCGLDARRDRRSDWQSRPNR